MAATTHRYALLSVPEYAPMFVSVRDLQVKNFHITEVSDGQEVNRDLIFNAEFESSYPLERVIMVLELITEKEEKMIFLRQIGTLARHEPHTVSVTVPMTADLGLARYHLHLFVNGHEVLHSLIPSGVREEILDGMVARRIKGAGDGPPQPFIDPAPEYPGALLKAKVTGSVVVHFHIDTRGRVQSPQVMKTSDPAFGASALEAIQAWRFLPLIRKGQPVETVAEMPFDFSPPPTNDGG